MWTRISKLIPRPHNDFSRIMLRSSHSEIPIERLFRPSPTATRHLRQIKDWTELLYPGPVRLIVFERVEKTCFYALLNVCLSYDDPDVSEKKLVWTSSAEKNVGIDPLVLYLHKDVQKLIRNASGLCTLDFKDGNLMLERKV